MPPRIELIINNCVNPPVHPSWLALGPSRCARIPERERSHCKVSKHISAIILGKWPLFKNTTAQRSPPLVTRSSEVSETSAQ